MDYELKHKWEVNRNAWFIRLFCWVWDTPANKLDFCKLFWGFLFIWVALIIQLVIFLLSPLVSRIEAWLTARENKTLAATATGPSIPIAVEEVEEGPSKLLILLQKIGFFFAKVGYKVASIWFKIKKPVFYIALVVGILLGVAAGVAIVYLILHFPFKVLEFIGILVGAVLVVLLFMLIAHGIQTYKDSDYRKRRKEKKALKRANNGLTLGGVLKQGFIAVKTNTCPQIVLKD